MKKIFLIVIVICTLTTISFAQASKNTKSNFLIDAKKPLVFISFLRSEKVKSNTNDEENRLFFQMTNNSRWNILLDMGGAEKGFGDTRLFYAIEEVKTGTVISGSTSCHVCSRNNLGAGRSIVFSIPLGELTDDTRMRIAYSFDWEFDGSENGYSEHSVVYYFTNSPKSPSSSQQR